MPTMSLGRDVGLVSNISLSQTERYLAGGHLNCFPVCMPGSSETGNCWCVCCPLCRPAPLWASAHVRRAPVQL